MADLLGTDPPAAVLAGAVIVDELAALGVTDVVCCPGSRSAPLAYAAAAAEAAGRLRLHVRLDERGAGYFALGLAAAAGRAVAVITTSGTAVANLAPALAEARHARVPVIALTADRPATLIGTGANQTADQVGLLGTSPLLVVRIASADRAPAAWRAAVRRAVVTAEGRLTLRPGPVHVNVELTPPLLGDPGPLPPGVPFQVTPALAGPAVALDPGPGTVIVAGALDPPTGAWWAEAAERAHVPLLAEPSSNARRGVALSAYRYLLPGFAPAIERVIVVGHPTLSRSVTALLGRTDIDIIAVDASGEWPDPGWAVSAVHPRVSLGLGDPAWLARWTAADRRLRARIDAGPAWSGERVAATVWAHAGPADALVLGSSNSIRDADLAPVGHHSPLVYAQRGLAGIDGTIAYAAGVAAGLQRHTVALVGDLTALHDSASLATPALERPVDLTIVVADDHGGSLFASLEYGQPASQIGDLAEWFERLFAVPMKPDIVAVAEGFGVPATTVTSAAELSHALAAEASGLRLIRARLDRGTRGERERQLAAWGRQAVREATA